MINACLTFQPKETKLISETAGLLKPEKVADAILTDAIVSNGEFRKTFLVYRTAMIG